MLRVTTMKEEDQMRQWELREKKYQDQIGYLKGDVEYLRKENFQLKRQADLEKRRADERVKNISASMDAVLVSVLKKYGTGIFNEDELTGWKIEIDMPVIDKLQKHVHAEKLPGNVYRVSMVKEDGNDKK